METRFREQVYARLFIAVIFDTGITGKFHFFSQSISKALHRKKNPKKKRKPHTTFGGGLYDQHFCLFPQICLPVVVGHVGIQVRCQFKECLLCSKLGTSG